MIRRLAVVAFLLGCRATPAAPPSVATTEGPNVYDPRRFGARCDSTGTPGTGADDTKALQAALDAAKASHGTVTLRGACRTTRTLVLSGASDVVLQGGGAGRLVFDGPEVGLSIQRSTRVSLEGLSLSGHGVSVGVVIRDSSFVRVARCTVSGATHKPKSLSPPYAAGLLLWSADDVTVEDNLFHGNGAGVEDFGGADILTSSAGVHHRRLVIAGNRLTSTATGQNLTLFDTSFSRVSGNVVSGASWLNGNHLSGGYGILIYQTATPGAESGRNVVESNVVFDTAGSGIFLQGQPGSVVAENMVTSVALRQLHESLSNGCIAVESSASGPGVSVTGNHVADCGLPHLPWPAWEKAAAYERGVLVKHENRFWHSLRSANQGHAPGAGEWWSEIRAGGIEALGRGNSLTGNTVQRSAGAGIVARDMHEGTIASNVVHDAGAQGILCIGTPTCEGVVVSSNQISDNGRLGDGGAFGISGPFGHSSIVGNTLLRIGGVGITNAGAGDHDMIANNVIVDSGLATPAFPAIHLYGGSAHVVTWNKISTSGAKVHSKACFADAAQGSSFYGNDCTLASTGVATSPGPQTLSGTAPPKSGTWVVGDRVLNAKAGVQGQPLGWICTVAGTPGEWVPIPKAP